MDYFTKDSGERKTFETGMQRDTSTDKPRFDLITPLDLPYNEQLLTRWAKLMQRGSIKYGNRNWEKARTAEELDRYIESAYRHFMQWFHGETDEDHCVAVMFNLTGAEYVKWQLRDQKEVKKVFCDGISSGPAEIDAYDDLAQDTTLKYAGHNLFTQEQL